MDSTKKRHVTASRPITILDLARFRGAKEADGSINGGEFDRVGLSIMGGCEVCGASLAAYNACPSRSGYWRCASGCIDGDGWTDVETADREIREAEDGPSDDELMNRPGVEGGIAYDTSADEAGSLGEHDWRL